MRHNPSAFCRPTRGSRLKRRDCSIRARPDRSPARRNAHRYHGILFANRCPQAYRECMPVLRSLLLVPLLATFAHAGGVTWTDRGASAIKRMGFDGSGLVTVPVSGAVSSPGTNLRGIALDVLGGRMFWADNGADRILRANLDGTNTVIPASPPARRVTR